MWSIPVSFGGFFTSALSSTLPSLPPPSNDSFINKADGTLDMASNKIINLAQPTEDNDAATKKYVETALSKKDGTFLEKEYQRIKTIYKPTFWISSKFPLGFDGKGSSIQDLSGVGLTINGNFEKDLIFNENSSILSKATYGGVFTFFIKGKKTGGAGRLFTAEKSNMLIGWWENQIRCAWMDEEIYGLFSNKKAEDKKVHTFILTNNEDMKRFLENKMEYILTNQGSTVWGEKVVIGRPVAFANESSTCQFYEVICFSKVLNDEQITDIYDSILAEES